MVDEARGQIECQSAQINVTRSTYPILIKLREAMRGRAATKAQKSLQCDLAGPFRAGFMLRIRSQLGSQAGCFGSKEQRLVDKGGGLTTLQPLNRSDEYDKETVRSASQDPH